MARSHRLPSPGAVHHVILRGNQGRPIFYSDADKCRCCHLLQEGVERFGHRILAFCLMTNHIHLAILQGEISLSKAIQNFAFRHAQRVNRTRKEVGHVFQGRFKAIRVDTRKYLLHLVRYIHLNPVRAGLVKKPEEYKWSGHNSYLGTDPIYWLERDYLLSKLSEERSEAIGRYNEFVCAGIGVDPEYDFETGSQAGILGDDDFVKEILGAVEISKSRENTLALPELINMVCHKYNVSLQDLISSTKEKSISHVRGLLALLVRESTEFTLVELGEIIMRNTSGLSQLANRSAKRSRNNLNFQQEINEIRQMLTS